MLKVELHYGLSIALPVCTVERRRTIADLSTGRVSLRSHSFKGPEEILLDVR